MRGLMHDTDDPLTRLLLPPPGESEEEREERLTKEAEAQRVSDLIDESLRAERAALKKQKVMKMLLLGQSESGKTTTLKNMQLTYAPRAWEQEKASWRAVIQLNLVRSINVILDALALRLAATPASSRKSSMSPISPSSGRFMSPPPSPTLEDNPYSSMGSIPSERRNHLLKLRLRLAPLRQVEVDLKARLGDGTNELTELNIGSEPLFASPFDDAPAISSRPSKEVTVRSHQSFKDKERDRKTKNRTSLRQTPTGVDVDRDPVSDVLAGCADDMVTLWEDSVIQDLVDAGALESLGDSAKYFLRRISDIAKRDYTPSDVDVLRARIRTVGVQEYNIAFEIRLERDIWREWAIYDVGGARTQRRAWVPYFSDVQAIVFLAPISVFDERLAEDRKINRLQDSFALWDAITKSPLLQQCILILFMNKCDLLQQKLDRGVLVKTHLPSFADRPNDFTNFTKFQGRAQLQLAQAAVLLAHDVCDRESSFACLSDSQIPLNVRDVPGAGRRRDGENAAVR
ncbi:hypothetical protein NM688_g8198 [Phlebia brevispora]|uniref:Uncharacterized protein n=1 Tax=Phlebia brevispora TaxID=194682 RepID=A0ACC1RVZ7_9APHY|nr:hypothetical protein NM688_g8198 [Phlebia brevispora]